MLCSKEIFNYWAWCSNLEEDGIYCFECYKFHLSECNFDDRSHTCFQKYKIHDLQSLLEISEKLKVSGERKNLDANVLVHSLCGRSNYNFIESLSEDGVWKQSNFADELGLPSHDDDESIGDFDFEEIFPIKNKKKNARDKKCLVPANSQLDFGEIGSKKIVVESQAVDVKTSCVGGPDFEIGFSDKGNSRGSNKVYLTKRGDLNQSGENCQDGEFATKFPCGGKRNFPVICKEFSQEVTPKN